jgi:metallo-beta-lactamase class B
MERKLICLLFAAIVLLPMTLLAGPKDGMSETPITAPRNTVFDKCGPPHNPYTNPVVGDLTPMGPYKLFDNFYYIGTHNVGSFVIDTKAGLILIDAGWGDRDCQSMMDDLRKLGFNPADVKLILLSHEHIDHYGCVESWKETYCPRAKVALTQLGWNYLRTWPVEAAFDNPRPKSIGMYLTDGQRVKLGNTTIEIVFTPGHSPGCVSFIIPVRDHGKKHVIGIMGGTAVPRNWNEALLYHTSVERFQQKCIEAKCDVGLGFHAKDYKADFEKLLTRKPGEPNPLVIGTERFVTKYIEMYKKMARDQFDKLPAEHFGPPRECP